MTYEPKPIDLSEIVLSDEIMALIEHLAENTHKVWAQARLNEGWTYGEKRDDEKKKHPCMLPYNRLPESEKEYDRTITLNILKLIKKLGYEIKRS